MTGFRLGVDCFAGCRTVYGQLEAGDGPDEPILFRGQPLQEQNLVLDFLDSVIQDQLDMPARITVTVAVLRDDQVALGAEQ